MGDFAELIVFLAVVLISLLVGGKKRSKQQQRPAARRPQARPVRRPQTLSPTPQGTAGAPTRESLAREILQLLGAEVPQESAPPEEEPPAPQRSYVALDDYRREAISLERAPEEARSLDSVELSRQREHDEFHDRYVDSGAQPQPRRAASRYHRITPRTAREAVIWKTIFSPPKALE